jgi:hypothetical protein
VIKKSLTFQRRSGKRSFGAGPWFSVLLRVRHACGWTRLCFTIARLTPDLSSCAGKRKPRDCTPQIFQGKTKWKEKEAEKGTEGPRHPNHFLGPLPQPYCVGPFSIVYVHSAVPELLEYFDSNIARNFELSKGGYPLMIRKHWTPSPEQYDCKTSPSITIHFRRVCLLPIRVSTATLVNLRHYRPISRLAHESQGAGSAASTKGSLNEY